jgi:hypothetical protein
MPQRLWCAPARRGTAREPPAAKTLSAALVPISPSHPVTVTVVTVTGWVNSGGYPGATGVAAERGPENRPRSGLNPVRGTFGLQNGQRLLHGPENGLSDHCEFWGGGPPRCGGLKILARGRWVVPLPVPPGRLLLPRGHRECALDFLGSPTNQGLLGASSGKTPQPDPHHLPLARPCDRGRPWRPALCWVRTQPCRRSANFSCARTRCPFCPYLMS